MTKWIDRMMNWGFLAVPLFIALVVFALGRLGCSADSLKEMESVKEKPAVTSSLKGTNEQTLLRR